MSPMDVDGRVTLRPLECHVHKAYISMLLRITRIAILRPFHLQNASTLHATLLIYLWIASASRNSQKIKYAERNSQRSHLLMAV